MEIAGKMLNNTKAATTAKKERRKRLFKVNNQKIVKQIFIRIMTGVPRLNTAVSGNLLGGRNGKIKRINNARKKKMLIRKRMREINFISIFFSRIK